MTRRIAPLLARDPGKPAKAAMALWACWIAIVAAAGVAASLRYTGGRWLLPLDDVYITLAYARNWSHALPFRFNPGDPVSTGATSLLYTWLLVPVSALGGGHEAALTIGIIALNAGLWWWTCRLAWELASHLCPGWPAHAAVAALLLNGSIAWGFMCGMDTGLAAALLLAVWLAWNSAPADHDPRWWVKPGLASLGLALARPEGSGLALVAGAWAAAQAWTSGQGRRARISLAVGAAAFLIAAAAPILLTGGALPSSAWAKTAWASPFVSPWLALSGSGRFVVDAVKGYWMGMYPAAGAVGFAGTAEAGNEPIWAFPPLALACFLLGALPAGPGRWTSAFGGLLWAAGFAAIALVLPVGWHHHRYLILISPVFILISFAGIVRLGDAFPEPWRRTLPRLLAGAWLLFSLPGLVQSVLWSARGAGAYGAHHRLMAERLQALADPGAVAATDVGILAFFTDRTVMDVKALTSPWLAPAAQRGWGSLFDRFKRAAPADRPRFAALHKNRPDVDAELLIRAGVLRERFSLPHPGMPSEFALFDCAWGENGPAPGAPGWTLVDELDCAEPASELAHGYRPRMLGPEFPPYSTVQVRTDSATRQPTGDGGWVVNGGERFVLAATPGRPLLVLMRTYAPRASSVRPSLNGEALASLPIAANPERFQSILLFSVPSAKVLARNTVEVACGWPDAREYSSYHYWALQPTPETARK